MEDIVYCPPEVIDYSPELGARDDCGLVYTDNRDVQRLYENLLEGSENHLRAFVRQIEKRNGGIPYAAQYLSQEEVDDILGR